MRDNSSTEKVAAKVSAGRALTDLAGLGPASALALERHLVRDQLDLVRLIPRRLAEGTDAEPIASARAKVGAEVRVQARVERTSLQRFGRRSILRVTVTDASGSIVALFFNQPWLQKRLVVGHELELRGKVVVRSAFQERVAASPAVAPSTRADTPRDASAKGRAAENAAPLTRADLARQAQATLAHAPAARAEPMLVAPRLGSSGKPLPGAGDLRPVYPEVEGISAERLRAFCLAALANNAAHIHEPISSVELARHDLASLPEAVRELHLPTSIAAFDRARRRLFLERLIELQSRVHARRADRGKGGALVAACDDAAERAIRARFPYAFTAAQERVARELRADLACAAPMRRLLQGDVGSGKTAMGLFACLLVARAGGQSAFLAPTELLAEQHYAGLAPLLERAGLRSVLLTGSLSAPERRAVLAQLARGEADVAFGTHALFSSAVVYKRLSLAVIDEQHRFGVAQRGELLEKGSAVHALLMSATPIPRTLALSYYGDLDTSLIDERPPGRGSVTTEWVRAPRKRSIEALLVERVERGERLYWVVPRIGGGEEEAAAAPKRGKAESAESRYERLLASPLAPYGVDLVHGRLPMAERHARLARFRAGESRTLVATTVIEVGVDVPEATMLVVEGAERLGLAQLHQLRGRIGRGAADGICLLFGERSAAARFQILERTFDGFEIAEADLEQRGMGELTGLRQSGIALEGCTDLAADLGLLALARDIVARGDHALTSFPTRLEREGVRSKPIVSVP